jgi:hypothetical protein
MALRRHRVLFQPDIVRVLSPMSRGCQLLQDEPSATGKHSRGNPMDRQHSEAQCELFDIIRVIVLLGSFTSRRVFAEKAAANIQCRVQHIPAPRSVKYLTCQYPAEHVGFSGDKHSGDEFLLNAGPE